MESEQLKPIVTRLTKQLAETLVKISPGIDKHYWVSNPSFTGLRFLIEKALPEIDKAGDSEIKQILDLTRTAKDYFKIHLNNNVFATCYIFVSSTIVNGLQYDFDDTLVSHYIEKNYSQVSIKTLYTKSEPFNYCMIDQPINGFTKHTVARLTAGKINNREIKIYTQVCPKPDEICVLPELDEELKIDRNVLLESVKEEWGKEIISKKSQEIKTEFKQFAFEVLKEYEKLNETFEALVSVLISEINLRENNSQTGYIKLPFDDVKNDEMIDYIFQSLNGLCFTTSKENFKKIFTPDKTFTKIKWDWKPNVLVCLFTGFNFNIDGFDIKFPGIMANKQNKWNILADRFYIARKNENTPLHHQFNIIKRRNQRPNEFKKIVSFLKKIEKVYKSI